MKLVYYLLATLLLVFVVPFGNAAPQFRDEVIISDIIISPSSLACGTNFPVLVELKNDANEATEVTVELFQHDAKIDEVSGVIRLQEHQYNIVPFAVHASKPFNGELEFEAVASTLDKSTHFVKSFVFTCEKKPTPIFSQQMIAPEPAPQAQESPQQYSISYMAIASFVLGAVVLILIVLYVLKQYFEI